MRCLALVRRAERRVRRAERRAVCGFGAGLSGPAVEAPLGGGVALLLLVPGRLMSDFDSQCLAAFSNWLGTLAEDAKALAGAVADEELPGEVRRPLAGALNYLFKSLDLIDDGIENLGYLDDAFVLRVATAKMGNAAPEALRPLADDAALVREFLGDMAPRFEAFVSSLQESTVRGRSVDAIVTDEATREELLDDVRGWANRYETPDFVADDKSLVKLRSFLNAKLPA